MGKSRRKAGQRGRPRGSRRITDELAADFALTPSVRKLIDSTCPPGGGQELAGLQALNAYSEERRAGRDHSEARERAARYLGIQPRQLDTRLKHIREPREAGMAAEYRQLRSHPRQPRTVDAALLDCIRRWGYGDGKPDSRGRVVGLESVIRALKRQGITEVESTTLKPRRRRI
jgi:hypothetical protein